MSIEAFYCPEEGAFYLNYKPDAESPALIPFNTAPKLSWVLLKGLLFRFFEIWWDMEFLSWEIYFALLWATLCPWEVLGSLPTLKLLTDGKPPKFYPVTFILELNSSDVNFVTSEWLVMGAMHFWEFLLFTKEKACGEMLGEFLACSICFWVGETIKLLVIFYP